MAAPDREPPAAGPMEWLNEAQGRGIVPGLGRMERLLAALGNPERSLRCLHVAGTNGKGSVCAFAESVLRAAGLRTGLYTSPHLVRFSERIRLNGEEVSESLIEEGIGRLRAATSGWNEEEMPTYFELVTALAFDLFARTGVEVVVLETGLGGRLDATNTAPKLACAITPIGLDHTEWLGGTLAEIAREKAGIFRSGVPAVTALQEPEALAALKKPASTLGVTLRSAGEQVPGSLRLGLAGAYQRENAALALSLLRAGGFNPPEEAVCRGLEIVSWPGRFQRLGHRGRELVLDGAHNLHAMRRLAETWREEYGSRRCTLIFGALSDKDPAALIEELVPLASEIFLVRVDSPRTADPEALVGAVSGQKIAVHIVHTLSHALERVFGGEKPGADVPQPPVLLAGSLFLVGEALSLISGGHPIRRTQ
jgi:dihydrofolate synthase / folylpolyglutamate synthase